MVLSFSVHFAKCHNSLIIIDFDDAKWIMLAIYDVTVLTFFFLYFLVQKKSNKFGWGLCARPVVISTKIRLLSSDFFEWNIFLFRQQTIYTTHISTQESWINLKLFTCYYLSFSPTRWVSLRFIVVICSVT